MKPEDLELYASGFYEMARRSKELSGAYSSFGNFLRAVASSIPLPAYRCGTSHSKVVIFSGESMCEEPRAVFELSPGVDGDYVTFVLAVIRRSGESLRTTSMSQVYTYQSAISEIRDWFNRFEWAAERDHYEWEIQPKD